MEVVFERDEIDKLEVIVAGQRDALMDQVMEAFPDGKSAEALCFAVVMLFTSAFTSDAEQQYDVSTAVNQVLARAVITIPWRLTPLDP